MVPNNKDSNKDSALSVQVGGDHYKNYKIQPIDFIYSNDLPFIEGCIIKYICRYEKKGTPIEDLKKIKLYVDILIEKEEEGLDENTSTNDATDYYYDHYHKLCWLEQARKNLANYQRCSNDD